MNGGGGVGAAKISLRLQYYVLLAGVGAVLLVGCLKYMPAAAVVAAGYGSWGSGLAVATRAAEPDAEAATKRSPVVIFNFGDSNSDTGGMAAASGLNIALPEGRTYFRRPTGRLSDGRLVIDFICESLGTPHLSPYLKALGSDFSNGANFAIGGSTATPGGSPFSLDVQLHQFLYFRTRSFELLNKGERTPIDREGFRNAIYAMDIGHNDLSAYLHLPYDQVLAKIPAIVGHIKFAMETLYAHGARKFWIHGTGALGCLPQKLSIPRDDDSDLDANGCLNKYNNVAKAFNEKLAETCNQLRQRMADAAIVFTDLYPIKYDLVANHSKYGVERPLMACCGNGGPPHNYNHFKMCMSGEMQLCDMDAKFISWDGIHLTEFANAIVASRLLTGDYSRPRVRIATLVNSTAPHDG
ncbi:GDSL esterase/lipase At1g09390-like [Triticum dicoccoides]|uniref:GDSL esterase/lipase At1g09390-like n=1 Tax=Triticum dicoccoides TaxID=85692 RepID=UPI000E7D0FD3|nr:GDSL esterase/lipase At1g09390-like [Triticum dicoccoides]